MPPTRGHDLKQEQAAAEKQAKPMPPTRGHDLKQIDNQYERLGRMGCPPHGGTT